jgi:hypothetical protein
MTNTNRVLIYLKSKIDKRLSINLTRKNRIFYLQFLINILIFHSIV